ncbi:MAG: rhomboid family intramembrane serine protease [Verrucomicrobiota bacterium]
MPVCPKCDTNLVRKRKHEGVFWSCQSCQGSAVTMSLLRKTVPRYALNKLWQRARMEGVEKKYKCPGCIHRMKQVTVLVSGQEQRIDVCTTCQFVWLDAGEWADFARFEFKEVSKEDLQAQVRARIQQKRLARNAPPATEPAIPRKKPIKTVEIARKPDRRSERMRPRPDRRPMPSRAPMKRRADLRPVKPRKPRKVARSEESPKLWHWIPGLLGMPVENEQPTVKRTVDEKPWFTWTLATGILLISLVAMLDLNSAISAYGLIPAEFDRLGGLTWLTSFFLHADLLHLLGNLYFLVVFGDNVEKCLGALELFFLIVFATIFGSFVHILMDPASTIPCVGASGGISGVIAFYALRFPKTELSMMFWFIPPLWFRVKAIWLFGLWVLLQLVIASQQMAGMSNISGGAHLGGALIGFLAWFIWRINSVQTYARPVRSIA